MKDMRSRSDADASRTDLPEPSEEMIALYREHMPAYLAALNSALEENDEEAVRFQCHKMASAVKIMGFDNIAEILESIQRQQSTGNELRDQCQRVEKLVGHTLALLSK